VLELSIKTDISSVKHFVKKYPEVSLGVRKAKVSEALMLLEAAVKKATPYGAGPIHLRDSETSAVKVRGSKVVGVTGTPLEHGEPVESGTKPHFPPLGPIQFWVERKLGIYDEKQAKSVAFLVARAISKRGTKGAQMFKNTMKDNEAKVLAILNEIPREIIRRVKGKMS
jgi:hypothetical protein